MKVSDCTNANSKAIPEYKTSQIISYINKIAYEPSQALDQPALTEQSVRCPPLEGLNTVQGKLRSCPADGHAILWEKLRPGHIQNHMYL